MGYLGPNGAGKTTTLRLLTGALRPDTGRARLSSADAWRDRRRAHEHLGSLPAEPKVEPRLRGRDLLGLSARLHRVPAATSALPQRRLAERS